MFGFSSKPAIVPSPDDLPRLVILMQCWWNSFRGGQAKLSKHIGIKAHDEESFNTDIVFIYYRNGPEIKEIVSLDTLKIPVDNGLAWSHPSFKVLEEPLVKLLENYFSSHQETRNTEAKYLLEKIQDELRGIK